MNRLAILAAGIGLAAAVGPAFADTTYTFTSVADPADITFTQLLGVNKAGAIAGYFGSGATGHPNQGFTLALPATFTSENYPNSVQTQVVAINNNSDTGGFYIDAAGNTHGFLRLKGNFSTIDLPETTFNQILGLNDHNEAAGYYQDVQGVFHAYTVEGGIFTSVTFAGAVSTQATGVNDSGLVSGFNQTSASTSTGFVIDGTALNTLVFPGAPMTQALGLNNNGQVVGSYVDANGLTHGFLYTLSAGAYQSIDEPDANGMTIVNGINDQGEIVGFYLDATGNTVGFAGMPSAVTPPALVAAVLPGARSVLAGTPATVFATMINTTSASLSNCQIRLPDWAPTGLTLSYQTTNPVTNALTGQPNTPLTIPGNGSQSFVLAFDSTAALNSPTTALTFSCDGGASAPLVPGVDTVDLIFSTMPIADVIALAATVSNNGVVTAMQSRNEAGAFAVASVNVGAGAPITISADTGNTTLPIALTLCQTNTATGACLAPPASTVQLDFASGTTPTFSVFVSANSPVPFDPATARIFLRFFDDNGASHGSTSVALATN